MKLKRITAVLCLSLLYTSNASEQNVNLHGFLSQGYLHSSRNNYIADSSDGTFDFREYGLNLSFYLFDNVSVGAQVAAREYGVVGNDTLLVDWFQLDYDWQDWLGFRVGKMKVPYGLYGETRDIDSLRTEILLPQGVYMEYIREFYNATVGGMIYGDISLRGAGDLSYQLQVGERDMDAENGDMQRVLSNMGFQIDKFDQKSSYAAGLVWNTPLENLNLGITHSSGSYKIIGANGSFEADIPSENLGILSIEYSTEKFSIASEHMFGDFDSTFTVTALPLGQISVSQSYYGCYLRGAYQVNDQWSLASGYSFFETNQTTDYGFKTTISNQRQDDIFFSMRYDINEYIILKAEHHFLCGSAGIFSSENKTASGTSAEKEYSTLSAFKLSIIF